MPKPKKQINSSSRCRIQMIEEIRLLPCRAKLPAQPHWRETSPSRVSSRSWRQPRGEGQPPSPPSQRSLTGWVATPSSTPPIQRPCPRQVSPGIRVLKLGQGQCSTIMQGALRGQVGITGAETLPLRLAGPSLHPSLPSLQCLAYPSMLGLWPSLLDYSYHAHNGHCNMAEPSLMQLHTCSPPKLLRIHALIDLVGCHLSVHATPSLMKYSIATSAYCVWQS